MKLLQDAIGSVIRFGLAYLAGYVVHAGIWTQGEANAYVSAATASVTLALLTIAWSLWQKYRAHILTLTALDAPSGTTLKAVQQTIADGLGAKLVTVLLIGGLGAGAVGLAGCSFALGGARHQAVVSVATAHAVLSTIQDDELLIVCGKPTAPAAPACVSPETHKQISAKLAIAFGYEIKVAQTVRALPDTISAPDVATLLGQIGALVDDVLRLLPDSASKALAAKVGVK